MKVAIIGAGPAGLAAAFQLCKAGIPVTVFEAGPAVGGLARTIELWGQKVDLGPHRFLSTDRRVNELWLEVVGRDYAMVNRLTRIFYRQKFFQYPLKPFDALLKLGIWEASVCLASYFKTRVRSPELDGSFENWVVQRFGRRLFEIFFKSYSEKLWGISCLELDADFAAQRIKKLDLLEAVLDALGLDRRMHKTLADQFAYPNGGTGMLYERMAETIRARGGQVHCQRPVQRVLVEHGRVTGLELETGAPLAFDHVISTMPLTVMVSRLPGVPDEIRRHAGALRYRNTLLVYLRVQGQQLFPDNWLYVHAPELRMGRITNFHNWGPHLHGNSPNTILALEYWCYDEDELWRADDAQLIALATQELERTGLIGGAPVMAGHVHRLWRCYPVYDRGYKDHLKPIEHYLSNIPGLSVIGRYGAFKYNNQDHSLLMGILAAQNLTANTNHNLWDINTDYENYQEAASITETGLQ